MQFIAQVLKNSTHNSFLVSPARIRPGPMQPPNYQVRARIGHGTPGVERCGVSQEKDGNHRNIFQIQKVSFKLSLIRDCICMKNPHHIAIYRHCSLILQWRPHPASKLHPGRGRNVASSIQEGTNFNEPLLNIKKFVQLQKQVEFTRLCRKLNDI